jgi:hypothetical protein
MNGLEFIKFVWWMPSHDISDHDPFVLQRLSMVSRRRYNRLRDVAKAKRISLRFLTTLPPEVVHLNVCDGEVLDLRLRARVDLRRLASLTGTVSSIEIIFLELTDSTTNPYPGCSCDVRKPIHGGVRCNNPERAGNGWPCQSGVD